MSNFKNIARFGVELEGGWNRDIPPAVYADCWRNDGSVHAYGERYTGEIATRPYARLSFLNKFITEMYPDIVDVSCGMHIHFSTPTLGIYDRYLDTRFNSGLLKYLRSLAHRTEDRFRAENIKWDKGIDWLYHRLDGNCGHARVTAPPIDMQLIAAGKRDVRYHAINYCYTLRKTIEIRVLPMFQRVENALYFIERTLSYAERFASLPSVAKNGIIVEVDENLSGTSSPYIVNV